MSAHSSDNLGRLRIVGFGEAISWLLLLGFAMPMKYIWHNPLPVKYVGWIHGILFITYITLAYIVKQERNWSFKKLATAFIAAFLPFGTFVFDAKLKAEQKLDK
jgi:integral membrane protein